jgi:hypothetical protein
MFAASKGSQRVTLGPAWNERHDRYAAEAAGSSTELIDRARTIAERFVSELEAIERATDGWVDEELTTLLVEAALSTALAELAETNCWGKANQLASSEIWRIAGRWLDKGWLQHRARTKPRGYAGDDELLTRICERTLSEDPVGRAFDRFFQGQAAAEVVRSRTAGLAAALTNRVVATQPSPFRVVSVGSGPALEIEQAVRALSVADRARLAVTLVDLDEEALDKARSRLATLLAPEQITVRRENLFRLANNPRLASCVGPADFSFCTGLFDYLADEPARALLALLWAGLAPGGTLLVGNFAPHCPTRAYMEWIGNWYLLYRTREELLQLALDAGLPADSCQVTAERLGIDLFLCAHKRAA